MNRIFRVLLVLPAIAFAQGGPANKFTVVPFAALSGEVPQRAGAKAANMLSTELKNTDGIELVAHAKPAAPDPYVEPLERARAKVKEAEGLRAKKKFTQAEEALKKATADFLAGGPGLDEVGELQDAYVLLSAVQFNTGRDEEGQKSLNQGLAIAPAREIPLAKTSALFSRVVEDSRKALNTGAKGTLLVESSPMGAAVTVDGLSLGATPLVIRDVPPGVHVWKVQLPSGEITGGNVEVTSGKQAKVSGQVTGTDPETKMLAALAMNKLDESVLAAAKEQAALAQADLLIFGALSKDGKALALDSFIFQASANQVRRLPRRTFDTELLSAGMEFYNLAGELAKKGLEVGLETKVPGSVAMGGFSEPKLVEAKYGQALGQELAPDENQPDTSKPKTPLEPKVRKPLKK